MQDQIHNRIEEFSKHSQHLDWDEMLQNIATLSIVTIFLLFGLSW
jgi:hypothetical protein